jgi:hypothetical protein
VFAIEDTAPPPEPQPHLIGPLELYPLHDKLPPRPMNVLELDLTVAMLLEMLPRETLKTFR